LILKGLQGEALLSSLGGLRGERALKQVLEFLNTVIKKIDTLETK
jgi:hypothetical protein